MPEVIARLCLDINVFYADLKARAYRVRPSACSELVEYISSGLSPAGGVQLIISVPMIEQWQNILVRHFGFSREAAEEMGDLLYAFASEGPLSLHPLLVVGSRFVPFETEQEMLREAVRHQRASQNPGTTRVGKLFDEFEDDRHVLLAAVAGRADVLATANIRDFRRNKVLKFTRDDVLVVPTATHNLVVAKPGFVNYWLRSGVVPNWEFVAERRDVFVPASDKASAGPIGGPDR